VESGRVALVTGGGGGIGRDVDEHAHVGGDPHQVVEQFRVGGHHERMAGGLGRAELDGTGHGGLRFGRVKGGWRRSGGT